ncbi:unnamed protein product, partial [Durusdinium trenchii]
MASYGDNKPVFRSRAAAAGLSDDFVQLLVDSHLDSLSKYAFCSSYVPGSGDDASFIRAIRNAIGRDPLIGEQASCRKLLHEAYALVTAEIKQQLERSEEVQTRKLTQPERSDLYQKQVKKLVGLSLKGPMEPSDALVDVFCGMYDANRLRFVPWEKYTSKECELEKSARVEHQFAVEGSGKLRVESKVPESAADTSSEILLQYALQRRGLRMEQANLLDYVIHQTWVDKLIRTRLQTPPDGYARVSFKQLLEADKKLFEELCDETRAGVQEHTINDGNAGLEEAQQGVLPADIAKGDKSADHFSRPISGTLKESSAEFPLGFPWLSGVWMDKALPDSMLRVVFNVLTNSPLVIMKRRLETLQRWRTWAGELEEGKHLALLEKIATELQWPDVSVHKEIRDGFRLVGLQKPSGVFSKDVKHRTLSERELLSQSKHIKPALWGKISSAPATEYQQDLWDITMQEVREKHWLQGPFSFEELEVMFDGVWMPVRRFAVWQRSKWRPIDDYTECGVNASFGYLEKIDLRALDQTVWVASCLIRHAIHLEFAEFRLSTGEVLRAPVDKHWKRRHSKEFVLTKTVDLKSAYKQLPISPIDRKLSILTLKSPRTGEVQGFVSRTLPFGSVASVLHFNRVARLLHRIGMELDVNWSNYFDDFPVVEFDELCQSTSGTIRALTHLLGFECSPDKEEPFSSSTHMLGMCLDTSSSHEGFVKVKNREDRTRELKDVVQDIIRLKCVQPKLLPSLFGRALFAESFFMGRAGRLALSELRHLEYSRKPRVELSKSQLDAFQ